MELLHTIIAAFRRMPSGVRYVTALSMLFTLLIPMACLPIGESFVDGHRVSFVEFWRAGGGILFASIGVTAATLSYGLIRARRWSRHLVVGLGWLLVVVTAFGWRGVSAEGVFAFLLFGCLPSWYFYFRRPVRDYFGFACKNPVAQRPR